MEEGSGEVRTPNEPAPSLCEGPPTLVASTHVQNRPPGSFYRIRLGAVNKTATLSGTGEGGRGYMRQGTRVKWMSFWE